MTARRADWRHRSLPSLRPSAQAGAAHPAPVAISDKRLSEIARVPLPDACAAGRLAAPVDSLPAFLHPSIHPTIHSSSQRPPGRIASERRRANPQERSLFSVQATLESLTQPLHVVYSQWTKRVTKHAECFDKLGRPARSVLAAKRRRQSDLLRCLLWCERSNQGPLEAKNSVLPARRRTKARRATMLGGSLMPRARVRVRLTVAPTVAKRYLIIFGESRTGRRL